MDKAENGTRIHDKKALGPPFKITQASIMSDTRSKNNNNQNEAIAHYQRCIIYTEHFTFSLLRPLQIHAHFRFSSTYQKHNNK